MEDTFCGICCPILRLCHLRTRNWTSNRTFRVNTSVAALRRSGLLVPCRKSESRAPNTSNTSYTTDRRDTELLSLFCINFETIFDYCHGSWMVSMLLMSCIQITQWRFKRQGSAPYDSKFSRRQLWNSVENDSDHKKLVYQSLFSSRAVWLAISSVRFCGCLGVSRVGIYQNVWESISKNRV